VLLVAAAFLGLILGPLTGGDLWAITRVRVRWPLVVLIALVIKELGERTPLSQVQGFDPAVYTASLTVLVLWTICHVRALPGVWIVTLGMALNLAVVIANGAHMPVTPEIARYGPPQIFEHGTLGQYVLQNAHTQLAFLDDRIPLPGVLNDWLHEAYSVGDLVATLGMFVLGLLLSRLPAAPDEQPAQAEGSMTAA
jgi:hypothetical protein